MFLDSVYWRKWRQKTAVKLKMTRLHSVARRKMRGKNVLFGRDLCDMSFVLLYWGSKSVWPLKNKYAWRGLLACVPSGWIDNHTAVMLLLPSSNLFVVLAYLKMPHGCLMSMFYTFTQCRTWRYIEWLWHCSFHAAVVYYYYYYYYYYYPPMNPHTVLYIECRRTVATKSDTVFFCLLLLWLIFQVSGWTVAQHVQRWIWNSCVSTCVSVPQPPIVRAIFPVQRSICSTDFSI